MARVAIPGKCAIVDALLATAKTWAAANCPEGFEPRGAAMYSPITDEVFVGCDNYIAIDLRSKSKISYHRVSAEDVVINKAMMGGRRVDSMRGIFVSTHLLDSLSTISRFSLIDIERYFYEADTLASSPGTHLEILTSIVPRVSRINPTEKGQANADL